MYNLLGLISMIIGIDGNEANVRQRVGSNIYAYSLLDWFAKLDQDRRFTVYLKSKPISDLPSSRENWQYRVLKPGKLWTRWRLPLDLYLNNPRPNIFFTPGHYAPKFCPVPFAISIMDLSFVHYPEMFIRQDLYQLVSWTRDSVRRASHIFTISQFSKDDIIKHYSIPEEKITVTYPGYDQERLAKDISAEEIIRVKKAYGITGDYLIYLGTLQPRKNLKKLIAAFAQLKKDDLNLVIAGKRGWLYSEILNEGKRLGIEKRVVFTDYLNSKDTPALIKGSRALVLVSLYEGFGIPVLEAMALGVPSVIAETSSLPEIGGDLAITVDPNAVKSITRGLYRVIQLNESQRKEISVKSKERAKEFTWKKAAEKTLEGLHAIAV